MPKVILGQPVDEKKWAEAKRLAAEEGHSEDYAYIMGIYKRMSGLSKAFDPSGLVRVPVTAILDGKPYQTYRWKRPAQAEAKKKESWFERAGDTVDGLEVLGDIPNQSSISASLNEYEVLPGIREVPMSAFVDSDPYKNYYAADDIDHVHNLAAQIKQSRKIKPLIVVIDKEGPYILEGGHRWSALGVLGKKSFPALVVMDTEDYDVEKSLTFSGWKLEGRRKVHGMDISIENKKGSVRRGKDKDGHAWATKMHADYGYVRGTVGKDKDHLDCYVGPNPESMKVFVIHQNDPATGKYDEDKTMLGFDSAEEAKALYMKQYDRPGFFGSMDETDIETFKEKAFADSNKGKKLIVKAIGARKAEGSGRLITVSRQRLEEIIERRYPDELAVGIKVEMEHTDDPVEARKIAFDHLIEDRHYYKKLLAAGLVDEAEAIEEAKKVGLKKSIRLDSPKDSQGPIKITVWVLQ